MLDNDKQQFAQIVRTTMMVCGGSAPEADVLRIWWAALLAHDIADVSAAFSQYATRDSVVEGFEASISMDVSMFAPQITVPTLLIGADNDPITTVAAQEKLLTLFPDARLTILAGVGHLVHYEKPREAATLIIDFLQDGYVAGTRA